MIGDGVFSDRCDADTSTSSRAPTTSDRALFAKWAAILSSAEAAQGVPFVPHNDLPDALAAYRHFLYGRGADRIFSYERYVTDDPSGRTTLDNAILDFRRGAEKLFRARTVGSGKSFQMTGSAIPCGSKDSDLSDLFPYPSTENWQKAIGAHSLWMWGNVTFQSASGRPTFLALMTMQVEDRYNFNPGANDIATGIPDSANGRFEVSGLAKQYLNLSKLVRHVTWSGLTDETPVVTRLSTRRERKPQDNTRIRNRL